MIKMINRDYYYYYADTIIPIIIIMLKLIRILLPIYLRERLTYRSDIHARFIRHQYTLAVPRHFVAKYQRSFTIIRTKLYVYLPAIEPKVSEYFYALS